MWSNLGVFETDSDWKRYLLNTGDHATRVMENPRVTESAGDTDVHGIRRLHGIRRMFFLKMEVWKRTYKDAEDFL